MSAAAGAISFFSTSRALKIDCYYSATALQMLYKYIYIYTHRQDRGQERRNIYIYIHIYVWPFCVAHLGPRGKKKKRCYFSAGVLWDKTDLRVKKSNLARRVFYWYFCNLWWACVTRLSPPCRNAPPLKKKKKILGFALWALFLSPFPSCCS